MIVYKLSLFWRKNHTDLEEVASFVEEDMFGSGPLWVIIGYICELFKEVWLLLKK